MKSKTYHWTMGTLSACNHNDIFVQSSIIYHGSQLRGSHKLVAGRRGSVRTYCIHILFLLVNLLHVRGVPIHWFYVPDYGFYKAHAHNQLRGWGRSEKIIDLVKLQDQRNILLVDRIP